jgi:protein-serine/threonine kinase
MGKGRRERVSVIFYKSDDCFSLCASLQHLGIPDENPWEFDTVRGPSTSQAHPSPDSQDAPVMHQSPPSTLPSSLRHLFEDDASPQADPFRSPIPQTKNTPSPPSSLPPSQSSSPARSRAPTEGRSMPDSSFDDMQTARQRNFAFPPRTPGARSKSKLASNVPGSEDEDRSSIKEALDKEPLPPLGPGIPLGKFSSKPSAEQNADLGESNQGNREMLIEDEMPSSSNPIIDLTAASTLTVSPAADLLPPSVRPLARKRSQSSADEPSSRARIPGQLNLDLASPSAFLFPIQRSGSPTPTARSGIPSSHSDAPNLTPGAHQTTYSLDTTSSGSRRSLASGSLYSQPAISRARSATALPDAAYPMSASAKLESGLQPFLLNRQRSVAAVENVPLMAPIKPFARNQRERSGSSSSDPPQNLNLPGLKDVLKV